MTFNPMMQQCVQRLIWDYPPDRHLGRSVCEFGNQTYTGGGGFKSTKAFYKHLGYEHYVALDQNTEMDAIEVDLNTDLSKMHRALGEFDLVTNNGTGEHIFDQGAIFRNAHWLCRPGGIMLHVLPFSPWINHGFYNYNPILFRDLARANNYEIMFRLIGDRNGHSWAINDEELYREKLPRKLEETVKVADRDLFVVFAFKHNGGSFKIPTQGKYNV